MGPNQNHPDFPKYKKRWDDLWDEMAKAVNAAKLEEEKENPVPVQDGIVDAVRRKYMAKIAALQREFQHLYD